MLFNFILQTESANCGPCLKLRGLGQAGPGWIGDGGWFRGSLLLQILLVFFPFRLFVSQLSALLFRVLLLLQLISLHGRLLQGVVAEILISLPVVCHVINKFNQLQTKNNKHGKKKKLPETTVAFLFNEKQNIAELLVANRAVPRTLCCVY